jgi:hypothetical protein
VSFEKFVFHRQNEVESAILFGKYDIMSFKNNFVSHPLLTQYGEIGSGFPTNVYDGNRLLLPILRQKMAQSDV